MSQDTPTIQVHVNGQDREVAAGLSVTQFLAEFDLRPELVVVERNREILRKDDYASVTVEAGDTLELVHFVGGG